MLVCQLYTSSASSASDLLLRTNRPKFCSLLFSLSWPYRKHADCRTCCSHVQRVIDRVDNRDLCDCAYPAHLMSTPPLGGPCCNTAMTLVMDKLEWCAGPAGLYPVKKVWIYAYSFRQNSRTWRTDGRTDRQTDTAWRHRPRLHSIARQNRFDKYWISWDIIYNWHAELTGVESGSFGCTNSSY